MAGAGLTAACLSTLGPRAHLPREDHCHKQDAQRWPEGCGQGSGLQLAGPGRYQGTRRGQR